MSTVFDTATADEAAFDGTAVRALRPRFDSDDFFGQQPTSTRSLPARARQDLDHAARARTDRTLGR